MKGRTDEIFCEARNGASCTRTTSHSDMLECNYPFKPVLGTPMWRGMGEEDAKLHPGVASQEFPNQELYGKTWCLHAQL